MIDDAQLDLLVDGELNDAQRREVLSRLDTEPDGWRRCALAFLEAQSWREGMRAVASQSAVAAAAIAPNSRPARRRLRTILAMAACFLLAFGLGLTIDDFAGRRVPSKSTIPATAQLVDVPVPAKTPAVEPFAAPSPEAAPEATVPYRYVSIPAEDPVSGKTESVRLPVVPQEYLGEGWPYRLPAVLPDRVVQRLRQRGHDVVQQRRLVPFQAADGSRVVFPVDEVELLPVGNRGYQ